MGNRAGTPGARVRDVQPGDLGKLIYWVNQNDVILQFTSGTDGLNGAGVLNNYSGNKSGTEVKVCVTNGHGVINLFNDDTTVDVNITGGSASNPKLNKTAGPVTLTMEDGVASCTVSADTAGTVTLSISGGNTSLDKSDTASVAVS